MDMEMNMDMELEFEYMGRDRHKLVTDLKGNPLRLTLRKVQDIKGRNYSLYNVCKVTYNDDGSREVKRLYSESLTEAQVRAFYERPTYYIPEKEEVNDEHTF